MHVGTSVYTPKIRDGQVIPATQVRWRDFVSGRLFTYGFSGKVQKEDIDPINTVTIVAESKSISHIESASDDEKEHAPGEILRKLEDPHLSDSARQGLIIEA